MGLDICFHHNHKSVLELRNHHEFLGFFDADIGGRVHEGYDDFFVTHVSLYAAEEHLKNELASAGIDRDSIECEIPKEFWDIDAREADWTYLLRCYAVLLARLRDYVRKHGPLVCAFS